VKIELDEIDLSDIISERYGRKVKVVRIEKRERYGGDEYIEVGSESRMSFKFEEV